MRYLTADYTKRINNFHFATTESCSTSLTLSIYNNLLSEHCNKVVPKSSSKRVDIKLCVSESCYEFNFRYEKLLKTDVHFQAKTTENKPHLVSKHSYKDGLFKSAVVEVNSLFCFQILSERDWV